MNEGNIIDKQALQRSLDLISEQCEEPSASDDLKDLLSKLAVLELCGWIEETIDNILKSEANSRSSASQVTTYFENRLKRLYNFEYDDIRSFTMMVIGIKGQVTLESQLGRPDLEELEWELSNLAPYRNDFAHRHIQGRTKHIYGPSWTILRFEKISLGLERLVNILHSIS